MEMFRECGFMALVVLGLGLVAALFGLVALALAILKPRIGLALGVVAIAASCGVPASGVVGTVHGRKVTDDAVSGVSIDAGQRERIRAVGYAEAGQCTTLGIGVGTLPVLMSLVALGVALVRRKSAAS